MVEYTLFLSVTHYAGHPPSLTVESGLTVEDSLISHTRGITLLIKNFHLNFQNI